MEKPIKEDYKPKEINDAHDVGEWFRNFSQAQDNYIDHLEAELNKKDLELSNTKADLKREKIRIKSQEKSTLEGLNLKLEIDHLKSTLYSEKQLQQAIKDGFNSKEWLRLPVSMDYPTYKEEQEDNA